MSVLKVSLVLLTYTAWGHILPRLIKLLHQARLRWLWFLQLLCLLACLVMSISHLGLQNQLALIQLVAVATFALDYIAWEEVAASRSVFLALAWDAREAVEVAAAVIAHLALELAVPTRAMMSQVRHRLALPKQLQNATKSARPRRVPLSATLIWAANVRLLR